MAPIFLPFRSSKPAIRLGLFFCTTIAGPYHQAGPVKETALSRSGVMWMLAATTSMRFDSMAEINWPNGITSYLILSIPIHLRAASWMSTSRPDALLEPGSRDEYGGDGEIPSVIPFCRAFASEGSPQLSNSGWASLLNSWAPTAPAEAISIAATSRPLSMPSSFTEEPDATLAGAFGLGAGRLRRPSTKNMIYSAGRVHTEGRFSPPRP